MLHGCSARCKFTIELLLHAYSRAARLAIYMPEVLQSQVIIFTVQTLDMLLCITLTMLLLLLACSHVAMLLCIGRSIVHPCAHYTSKAVMVLVL